MFADLRLAFRTLSKAPGFTLVAALTLALGVGANTAMFSVIDAVLLRPLPYPEPGRLVWIGETLKSNTTDEVTLTADFLDWREQNHVFTAMGAFNLPARTLTGSGEAAQLRTAKASADLLTILQARPALGRNFARSEDERGRDGVAMLSYGLWQSRFGGDRGVIGRSISLDDRAVTVVGVLPRDFYFPTSEAVDLLTPLGKNEAEELKERSQGSTIIRDVIARLKPGVTLEQARAEMAVIQARIPRPGFLSTVQVSVKVIPLRERFVGNMRVALITLLCAVGFLLLMACANVANLLLSRAVSREREMAIRSALGASRARLAKQLFAESLALAGLSCATGLALAFWTRALLLSFLPKSVPGLDALPIDGRVLWFAVFSAVASALLFGIGPAVAGAGGPILPSLNSGGGGSTGGARRQFWLNSLASAQIAIAIVLLTGGGLMLQSFWKLRYRDVGFRSDHLLAMEVQLTWARYPAGPKQSAFIDRLLTDLGSIPGVETTATGPIPPGEGHATNGIRIEGQELQPMGRRPVARQYSVSASYFRVLGIAVLAGRGIKESDTASSPAVALVNDSLAHRYFGGASPIGKKISTGPDQWFIIAGVVANVKTAGLAAGPEPAIYFPYRQTGIPDAGILVRTALDPTLIGPEIRKRVAQLDPNQPIARMQTLDQRLTESVARPRLAAVLLGCFAFLGIVLATVGLYGVMSCLVRWRFREIGIRMAMGARPWDVMRMVLLQSLKVVFAGLAVGIGSALWLNQLIQTLLYGTSPADPPTFVAAAAFLALVGIAAAYQPARQAAAIDPMAALRAE